MKKTILKFGVISGVVASAFMLATMPFMDKLGHAGYGYLVGYTGMVLAFLLVFFGIQSYRDNQCGGEIGFGRAFGVGIAITLISCAFYVATWEIVYFNFMHDFMAKYAAQMVDQVRASGASAAVVQAKVEEMKKMQVMYDKLPYNMALTFLEAFPVGLVMTLISAGVLRRKKRTSGAEGALPASS